MERLSAKLARMGPREWHAGQIGHWCPGCNGRHEIAVDAPNSCGARWKWDGNVERPTFEPSVNIRIGPFPDGHFVVCHYFLRAGRLQFLPDCTHALAGQTVDLPDMPPQWPEFVRRADGSFVL